VILPGSISTSSPTPAPSIGASTAGRATTAAHGAVTAVSVPGTVVVPAGNVPTTVPPTTVPLASGNGAVVRVDAVAAAPDTLAVASRIALGALKDRHGGGGGGMPASSPGIQPLMAPSGAITSSAPVPAGSAPMVDSGRGWQSTIVSTEAIETAVAKSVVVGGDPENEYATARSQVAALIAARTKGLDAVALDQVWARTDERRMTAIFAALAQVGTLYRYAGNTPGGFDCSGLTSYAWSVAGVKIPRTSTDQINAAVPKLTTEVQAGDLVWRPGHVGLYLGVGELMVHSPRTGKPVMVESWGKISRLGAFI